MIVSVLGGLSNRLRAMLSRYEHGMQVVWTRGWECSNEHFLDVFEPMAGIEFIDHPDGPTNNYGRPFTPSGKVLETCGADPMAPEGWERRYLDLVPIAPIRKSLDTLRATLGEYDAMHVRRTDGIPQAKKWAGRITEDEEFLEWSKDRTKVFLATDNAETQNLFGLRRSVIFQGQMEPSLADSPSGRRFTSLGAAVFDLYMCVGAREFMGSVGSSFTELIDAMRRLRK